MWDCITCACKAIAHDLSFCPMCGNSNNMGGSDDVTVTDAEQPADSGETAAAGGSKK